MKILKIIVLSFLGLFILLFFPFPSLVIDYKGCIEKKETKIVENLRVYEFISTGGYRFVEPLICVDEKPYRSCSIVWGRNAKTPLKEINSSKIITTGRVKKEYLFRGVGWGAIFIFGKLEVLEVLLNNKSYWISSSYYSDITSGTTWAKESKIETCPIYTIRGFTFTYY